MHYCLTIGVGPPMCQVNLKPINNNINYRGIFLWRSGRRLSYSSLLIPTMGRSCLFQEYMEHGILPNTLWSQDSNPTQIPITQIPCFRNQELLQFYSRSRPCRGLAAHLLSHSGPGGCPDHCVTQVCWFLAEGPRLVPLAFLCSLVLGTILGLDELDSYLTFFRIFGES